MTEIFAHRGESKYARENTVEAVKLAWENNADGIEIDVRLSSDKKIVVIHDRNTRRTAGRNGTVKNLTLEEIKNIDPSIPTLEEVLEIIPDGRSIMVEIKCGIEIIPSLKKILDMPSVKDSQILLAGFGLKKMTVIKNAFPDYIVYLIKRIDSENVILKSLRIERMISLCMKRGLDGLSLSNSRWLNKKNVDKIKNSGLKLFIWTVDNAKRAHRLKSYRVDGIISNSSGKLRKELSGST